MIGRSRLPSILAVFAAAFAAHAGAQNNQQRLDGGIGNGNGQVLLPIGNAQVDSRRPGLPSGWKKVGKGTERYLFLTDTGQGATMGKRFVEIQSVRHPETGSHIDPKDTTHDVQRFATMMQGIRADAYRGKRVRLSVNLRTQNADSAALWMRVDAQNGKVLAFDDMGPRKLSGTHPWGRQEVVLDVPAQSATIAFGFLLAGAGAVDASDFAFETVDAGIATTAASQPETASTLPEAPVNLDLPL